MAEFIIESTDSTYTYTSTIPVGIVFNNENNATFADTQGFLRKKQVGFSRVRVKVVAKVSRTDYESIFIPMEGYPTNFNVTFDRNIPSKDNSTGEFVLESPIVLLQEFPNNDFEIEINLTEVI